eukprot:gene12472-biopygen14358
MKAIARYTLLAGVAAALIEANAYGCWRVLQAVSETEQGSALQPAVRYKAASVVHRGQWIISHGYHYNKNKQQAVWLSDTWAYDFTKQDPGWAVLSNAQPSNISTAPCGRFGHAMAVLSGQLLLHGGNDGGLSKHGGQGYEPGYDMHDLFALDISQSAHDDIDADTAQQHSSIAWTMVQQSSSGSGGPGSRYLHSMLSLGDSVYLYGGGQERQGDVWQYRMGNWQLLTVQQEGPNSPGHLVGVSLIPVAGLEPSVRNASSGRARSAELHDSWVGSGDCRPQGFVLHGGRRYHSSLLGQELSREAYFFDTCKHHWRKLHQCELLGGSSRSSRHHHHHPTDHPEQQPATVPGLMYHAAAPLDAATAQLLQPVLRSLLAAAPTSSEAHVSGATQQPQQWNWQSPVLQGWIVMGGSKTAPAITCNAATYLAILDGSFQAVAWLRLRSECNHVWGVYDHEIALYNGSLYAFGGHLCRHHLHALAPAKFATWCTAAAGVHSQGRDGWLRPAGRSRHRFSGVVWQVARVYYRLMCWFETRLAQGRYNPVDENDAALMQPFDYTNALTKMDVVAAVKSTIQASRDGCTTQQKSEHICQSQKHTEL